MVGKGDCVIFCCGGVVPTGLGKRVGLIELEIWSGFVVIV